jgi:hypothetical protein
MKNAEGLGRGGSPIYMAKGERGKSKGETEGKFWNQNNKRSYSPMRTPAKWKVCVVIHIRHSSPGDTSSSTCPYFPNPMYEICQVLGDTKRHG